MSSNMYTEYVFGRPELDHATKDLQAISFNVAVQDQALLKKIRSYDFSKNSEELRNTVKQLQKQVEAKSKIFLDNSFNLSELLKELDSCYAVFQDLVNKSMKELIANNELSNSMNNVNTIPITNQNIMTKQDAQYLVDPKTNQLFLLDPTTGETQYVNSPIQGSGLNIGSINEMNNFVASQEDAQSNFASQSITQTGDVFEYKPVVSAIEATTDVPKIENGPDIISETPVVNDGPDIISEAPVASEEPIITSSTSVSNEAVSEEDKSLEKVKSSKEVSETATSSENPEEEFVAYDDARSTINNNEQSKSENDEEAAKVVEEVTTPPVEETSKEESGAIIEPVIVNESSEVKEISPVDIKTTPLIPAVDVVKPVGTVDSVDTVSTIGTVDTVPNVDDIIPLLPKPTGLSSSKDNSQDVIKGNDDSNKTTTDSSNNAKILEFPKVSEDSNKTTTDSSNKAEILEFHKKSGDSTKAIITSARQILKLRKSLKTQQALLNARGFFNLNAKEQDVGDSNIDFNNDDIKSMLETMLEKANKLYKEGKVDEAQKMYEKISEMNKQRQATEEEESNGYAYQLAA